MRFEVFGHQSRRNVTFVVLKQLHTCVLVAATYVLGAASDCTRRIHRRRYLICSPPITASTNGLEMYFVSFDCRITLSTASKHSV